MKTLGVANGSLRCKLYPAGMPVELNIGRGSRKAGTERLNE
jgi:hypothetical protein